MADTGKRLWSVNFRNPQDAARLAPRFNILAQTAREAEKKARLCLVDEGFPKTLLIRSLEDEGTVDEPAARKKGGRRG